MRSGWEAGGGFVGYFQGLPQEHLISAVGSQSEACCLPVFLSSSRLLSKEPLALAGGLPSNRPKQIVKTGLVHVGFSPLIHSASRTTG